MMLMSMSTHKGGFGMEDTIGQGPREIIQTSHHSGPNYRSPITASILMKHLTGTGKQNLC